ncbi:sigma-70 family RNA polymerase sigma factor [Sorangium sp. So ce119]|uniref:RNA polymerase sigma factor n=1 Tax=Sorangium sp. So ce119 TaxID=3133279 RepID=UPI003F6150DE
MGRPARTTPRFELFRRLATRLGVPGRNAEDVAQDALLRAWEARERIEPGGDPAPYAVTVALNQARTHTRNARRRGEVLTPFDDRELQDECPSPEDLVRRRQREALTRNLIGQLDPKYRDLLIKHELEEQPLADIAAELGLKLDTVRTQHRRAREHLEAAKRRWVARQRSRGWDEEACVPVGLGLFRRGWWIATLRKLGARVLVQVAFVALTGTVVGALPPSSGTEARFRPATVHGPAAAPLTLGTAPPGEQREVLPAVATTAALVQGIEPLSEMRAAPRVVAANRKHASSTPKAPNIPAPPLGGAARPTASEREKNLILEARKAIEARNARADVEARRLLDMHAMEFPRGQLAAEREALLLQVR